MKNLIECPAERAIYFLGGKWKIRILFTLYNNKKVRFNILKRGLKTITQQMLSKQLKELETDGIVNRKMHQVVPPKVEYSLTEFGLSVRALNCLKTAEVFTLGELVSFKKSDMLKFRNFGKKSLSELEDLIEDKGLTFGFDTVRYNLKD